MAVFIYDVQAAIDDGHLVVTGSGPSQTRVWVGGVDNSSNIILLGANGSGASRQVYTGGFICRPNGGGYDGVSTVVSANLEINITSLLGTIAELEAAIGDTLNPPVFANIGTTYPISPDFDPVLGYNTVDPPTVGINQIDLTDDFVAWAALTGFDDTKHLAVAIRNTATDSQFCACEAWEAAGAVQARLVVTTLDETGDPNLTTFFNGNVVAHTGTMDVGDTTLSVGAITGTVRVQNTGDDDLTPASIVITGSTLFALTDPFPDVLAPGDFVDIVVTFTPTTTGTFTATLTIVSDDPDTNPYTATLTADVLVSSTPTLLGFSAYPPWGSILTHQGNINNPIVTATDITFHGDTYSAAYTPGDGTTGNHGYWRTQSRGAAGIANNYDANELFDSVDIATLVAPDLSEIIALFQNATTGATANIPSGIACINLNAAMKLEIYNQTSLAAHDGTAELASPVWTSTTVLDADPTDPDKYHIRYRLNTLTHEFELYLFDEAGDELEHVLLIGFADNDLKINRIYNGTGVSIVTANTSPLDMRFGTHLVSSGGWFPTTSRVGIMMAAGNGFHGTGYTANGAATLWECLNQIPPDGDTTDISATVVDSIYSCTLQTFAQAGIPEDGIIYAIAPGHVAWGTLGSSATVAPGVRNGGVDEMADASTPGSSIDFHMRARAYTTMPITGDPFTVAGIEALEVITKFVSNPGGATTVYAGSLCCHVIFTGDSPVVPATIQVEDPEQVIPPYELALDYVVEFGTTQQGTPVDIVLTITNIGEEPLQLILTINTSLTTHFINFSEFSPGTILDPDETATITVRMLATTVGAKFGQLIIYHDGVNTAGGAGQFQVLLGGTVETLPSSPPILRASRVHRLTFDDNGLG